MEIENKDWLKSEQILSKWFLREGYSEEKAQNLGFFLRQSLENTVPILSLLKRCLENPDFEISNNEFEKVIVQIHMLFQNFDNLETAHKILMYKDIEK